jgi:hypothetical protein
MPIPDSQPLTKGLSMYETQIVENTIRPVSPEGDAWFGLESGTNGTAATMRRMNAPAGLEWRRHDGKPATGLLLNPRGSEWINPWDGRAS